MGTRTHKSARLFGLVLGFALLACGGDDTESKPPAGGGSNNFTDEDAASGAEHQDAGSGHADASGGHEDADVEDAGTGDASVAEDASDGCEGKDGCYKCKPTKSEQFLNSCAEGCRPFDESKYPSQWSPGDQLPDLP